MIKTRIYIIQFLGVLMLLCGYLLGDRPDHLSLMHFDSSRPSVITKSTKSTNNRLLTQTSLTAEHNSKHKTNVPKYISFELILPVKTGYIFEPLVMVQHTCALPENYCYLFYEEINPPPPKAC